MAVLTAAADRPGAAQQDPTCLHDRDFGDPRKRPYRRVLQGCDLKKGEAGSAGSKQVAKASSCARFALQVLLIAVDRLTVLMVPLYALAATGPNERRRPGVVLPFECLVLASKC